MKVYRPLLAAFAEDAGKDPAAKKAEAAIAAKLGDDRKLGWSAERQKTCRDLYAEHGAAINQNLSGALVDVSTATTSDSRNTYHKVRLSLKQDTGETVIVSLDRDTELCQRLLCKLNVVEPGTQVTLGAFVEPVARNGRTFVNHIPSLKGADGKEIPAESGHFAAASEKGKAAEAALSAAGLGSNKELVNKARAGAKVEYFAALAEQVAARFATPEAPEAQPKDASIDW